MTDADSGGSTVRGGPDGCIEIDWSLTGSPYDLRSEQYGSGMTALTLETAESIGVAIAVGLLALMLVMAFVVKNVVAKLISIFILGGLAFGVWTQRAALHDCADNVRARGLLGATGNVTCSFLGYDVEISAPSIS
jgi:hypothetical protein